MPSFGRRRPRAGQRGRGRQFVIVEIPKYVVVAAPPGVAALSFRLLTVVSPRFDGMSETIRRAACVGGGWRLRVKPILGGTRPCRLLTHLSPITIGV